MDRKNRLSSPLSWLFCCLMLLCGNAYLGGLAPALQATVMALGSHIACTAPLGAARARALIPGDDAVSDQYHLLNYYRLSRDHRLLFGGRLAFIIKDYIDRKFMKTFQAMEQ